MQPLAPEVHFGPSQAPSPRVTQYPAPYSPVTTDSTGSMTEMLGAIMPLIMLMMMIGMMMPMMKGLTAK